jgi:RNA 2',3'-cyclic 3'-phosphodiesterase
MTIRAFVAIEINKETRNKLSEFLTQLKKIDADVKWVACENIHLTLKFLGYIEENILSALDKIISDAVSCLRPFDINIENVGAFPSLKKPRVIFVCVQDKGSNLLKIYEKLDKGIEELGIMRDAKKYVGHITLGRIKSRKNIAALINALNSGVGYFFGQENVNYISLMQSKLTPNGPIYTTLRNFAIG